MVTAYDAGGREVAVDQTGETYTQSAERHSHTLRRARRQRARIDQSIRAMGYAAICDRYPEETPAEVCQMAEGPAGIEIEQPRGGLKLTREGNEVTVRLPGGLDPLVVELRD